MRHGARFIFQVQDHLVGHGLVKFVGVDIGAKNLARGLLVLAQQRRAGEADKDGAGQPALHLLVHVAALGAVAFVHKDIEAAVHLRRGTLEVRLELVDQRAEHPRGPGAQLLDKLRARGDARRACFGADEAGVAHHALDLLVQFVAVGDDQHARVGVILQQPLGQQQHEDAFAAALRVPDDAALAPAHPLLRCLEGKKLVGAGDLLVAAVEDNKIAQQVEQTIRAAHLRQRDIQQGPFGDLLALRGPWVGAPFGLFAPVGVLLLPGDKELFGCAGRAIAQPLRIAARKQELHRAEETLVENFLLVGDQLTHPVRHLRRGAL